jgi:predicted nucleic acid-binding protein
VADYYFESSSLAKAYVEEAGTDWVRTLLDEPEHRIFISAIAEVEVVSALMRRFNQGDLTREQLDQACDELRQDCAAYGNVDVTNQILEAAVGYVRTYRLRAYDAVQLASSAAVRTALLDQQAPVNFAMISADRDLNVAALLEGIAVEDPNTH